MIEKSKAETSASSAYEAASAVMSDSKIETPTLPLDGSGTEMRTRSKHILRSGDLGGLSNHPIRGLLFADVKPVKSWVRVRMSSTSCLENPPVIALYLIVTGTSAGPLDHETTELLSNGPQRPGLGDTGSTIDNRR